MKKYFSLFVLICTLFLIITCGKKDEEKTGELSQMEAKQGESTVQTIKPKPINYDSMLVVLSSLSDSVLANPEQPEFKQQLVAAGYDTLWDTILAPGFGKTPPSDSTKIDMQTRERAAVVDAYRWAAYIKKWHSDSSLSGFGSISTQMSGGRIVAKQTTVNNHVRVLLEIKGSKLQ